MYYSNQSILDSIQSFAFPEKYSIKRISNLFCENQLEKILLLSQK